MKPIQLLTGTLTITALLAVQAHAQTWLTDGLLAYYPLNGNANDASGNGNSGQIIGGTFVNSRLGVAQGAFSTATIAEGITTPLRETMVEAISISAWFKTTLGGMIIGHSDNAPHFVLCAGTSNTTGPGTEGVIVFGVQGHLGGVDRSIIQQTDNNHRFADGQWHQVVATYQRTANYVQSKDLAIYIDGVQLTNNISCDINPVSAPLTAATAQIGHDFGWNYVLPWGPAVSSITLDDLRIYGRALPRNEVTALFAYESSPSVDIHKAVYLTSTNLRPGSNYVVQASTDFLNWTNTGGVFTATTNSWTSTTYWPSTNSTPLYFRLQQK